jgi:hypothetical protein
VGVGVGSLFTGLGGGSLALTGADGTGGDFRSSSLSMDERSIMRIRDWLTEFRKYYDGKALKGRRCSGTRTF